MQTAQNVVSSLRRPIVTSHSLSSQDDEKKRGQAKKIPMVMKPKITLKVAKVVDNESASFSEASLGRSDWEWKPEEDASSVESGSSVEHDSSNGNESSATSLVQLGRPITTTKQSVKKRCTLKTSGRKK